MKKTAPKVLFCLLSTVGIGCGASAQSSPDETGDEWGAVSEMDFASQLQALNYNLVPGSTGADVAALHAYLLAFGYFPNTYFQREYPRWRPLVAERPASLSVYDERTTEAVRTLQALAGLPLTGIVDDDTRALLRRPRCGEPDGITPLTPDEKYALFNKYWTDTVDWYFDTSPFTGQASSDAWQRVATAFNIWTDQTSLSAIPIGTPTSRIRLRFGTTENSGWGGQTKRYGFWPDEPTVITFNNLKNWYFGPTYPPPAGDDFVLVALHEIGHSLGLDHSTMGYAPGSGFSTEIPTMGTGTPQRLGLAVDDKIAISMMYDKWTQIDSDTSDVGVGKNGDVWAVAASNHNVWKRNNTTGGWSNIFGDAGPIAVGANGWPYVIAGWGNGAIWYYNSNIPGSGIWQELPGGGCGRDIAAGPSASIGMNAIWVIGCDANPDGSIWKFGPDTGGVWREATGGGRAYRITVGSDGRPWVTTFSGSIWRYSTSGTNGYWELIDEPNWQQPSNPPTGHDIGVGPGDYPWVIDRQTGWPYTFNWQPQLPVGTQTFPYRRKWIGLPIPNIAGSRIAVGPNGDPWVVDGAHRLFKNIK